MQYAPAIFHDYFAIRGGGERLVLTLAGAMEHSTLIYGYCTSDSYDDWSFPTDAISLNVPAYLRRSRTHVPALTFAFARQRQWATRFSVRLFSGVAAPFAAPKTGSGGVNIFYCHTPPRFLYDQRSHFLGQEAFLKRPITQAVMTWFETGYRRAITRMDVIVTNSENTRDRIRRYLGRDSVVIHPPVDTDRFVWQGQRDYYLSTARLTGLKRVDRIIDAFLAMPTKRLIVVSSGEDLQKLKCMAADAPNIEFRSWVSDAELLDLVGNAIATIYMPKDEDFGMSPVESMAAGKPVIGVAEGGLLETIVPEQTGILLKPAFTKNDIIDAVTAMTPAKAASMRSACEMRAQDFTRSKFIANMKAIIDRSLDCSKL